MTRNRVVLSKDGIVHIDKRPAGTWRHDIAWSATVDFVQFAPRRTRAELIEAIVVLQELDQ